MTDDRSRECGLGVRGVAIAIDSVVWFGLFLVTTPLVGLATGNLETTANGIDSQLQGTSGLIGLAAWLGAAIGYHTVFEWLTGKTLGKYLVGIRVTNSDGSSLSLWRSVVRNVLRLVDWLPVFYVVGIIAVFSSGRNRRVGDLLGRTVVVRT